MDFKSWSGEYKEQRFAGLMLHYAPIAKYIASRLELPSPHPNLMLLPTALIALAREIENWPSADPAGFKDHVLVVMRDACVARVKEYLENPDEETEDVP